MPSPNSSAAAPVQQQCWSGHPLLSAEGSPAEKPRWCCSRIGCMWLGAKVCSMGPLSQLEYSGRFCRGSCGHPTLCSRGTAGVRQRHQQKRAQGGSGQPCRGSCGHPAQQIVADVTHPGHPHGGPRLQRCRAEAGGAWHSDAAQQTCQRYGGGGGGGGGVLGPLWVELEATTCSSAMGPPAEPDSGKT